MEASVTTPLPHGTYIDLLVEGDLHHPTDAIDYLNYEVYIQRLTDRSYMIMSNVFQSYVYRGNHGFLMMDCGGSNAGRPPFKFGPNGPEFQIGGQELENLEGALATIAQSVGKTYEQLPLKALVLSHPHTDHVGHSMGLKYKYPNLRIITSKQLVDRVRADRLAIALGDDACYDFVNTKPKDNCNYHPYLPRLPSQREIILSRFGTFKFEGQEFRLYTPEEVAHSAADSLLFSPDGVHMSVDTLGTEGRLSFVYNSVGAYMPGIIRLNRYLLGEAGYECDVTDPITGQACLEAGPTQQPSWNVALSGHFNVSYVEDVAHTLRYYRAMVDAWYPALFGAAQNGVPKSPDQFYSPDITSVDRLIMGIFDSQAKDMSTLLAPAYYDSFHWGSAYHDMEEINQDMFLYLNGAGNAVVAPDLQNPAPPPGGTVDFSPIPPGTVPEWGQLM